MQDVQKVCIVEWREDTKKLSVLLHLEEQKTFMHSSSVINFVSMVL